MEIRSLRERVKGKIPFCAFLTVVLLDCEIVLPIEVLVMVVVFEVVVVMPEFCFGEEHIFDALVTF